MPDSKRNILKIRCSDGRSRKPQAVREHFVHDIRLPGGILFADLCGQHFKRRVVDKLVRRAILYAVEVMVGLKKPDQVLVVAHSPCGAAEQLGLSEGAVIAAHRAWATRLKLRYPHLTVEVMIERHSDCGEHHHGHEVIPIAA